MYQPTTVRLFIKPFCGWCAEALEWLDRNKIKYNTLDVTCDRAAGDEMVRLSGQSCAPVIEVDGMASTEAAEQQRLHAHAQFT